MRHFWEEETVKALTRGHVIEYGAASRARKVTFPRLRTQVACLNPLVVAALSKHNMLDITLIDTSIGTDNLGDQIIMDAVNEVIYEIFPDAFVTRVPSHDPLSRRSLSYIRHSDLCIIGGTNIIASPGWRLRWFDPLVLSGAVCLGVTWGALDTAVTFGRRLLIRRLLAANLLHSVRDNYTRILLDKFGIRSVSTSCPTMWKLTPSHCARIPREKSSQALITLTSYKPDIQRDIQMIRILDRNYSRLYFFAQGRADIDYLRQLAPNFNVTIIPTVYGYNKVLDSEDVDVIGSRLHGGIRALQKQKRALIVGIDHRSVEISRDTGLPVLSRSNMDRLEDWINSGMETQISLPTADISAWCKQFERLRN